LTLKFKNKQKKLINIPLILLQWASMAELIIGKKDTQGKLFL